MSCTVTGYILRICIFYSCVRCAADCRSFFLKRYPTPAARWLWHCGVATHTCGSCVTGVIEIYGTECALLPLYAGVGAGLCILGIVAFLANGILTR